MEQIIYIPYGTKKYPLIITKAEHPDLVNEAGAIRVICKVANLDQYYNIEDLGTLIENLPDIITEQKSIGKRKNGVHVRLSPREKSQLELLASKNGYKNLSAYIRDKALQS